MASAGGTSVIAVRGATTHNLQNIDVDVECGKLVVVTGLSGSGKSSFAFDTVFAEGQRRYLESISVRTRNLLKQLPRPQVDEIRGLPPTVSVDQRVNTVPARSTLAVTTEIYDYLRLLFARAGTAHCTQCRQPVESQSVEQIVDRVIALPERSKVMVLSPLVRSRRGAHADVFQRISRHGYVRMRVDGTLCDVADVPELNANKAHTIDAVIDRIIVKDGARQRLRESIELAVRESGGTCEICVQEGDDWIDHFFSTQYSCADCGLSFPKPQPRLFSFHSAAGACPECEGFGVRGVLAEVDDVTVFRRSPCEACEGSRLQPFPRGVSFLGFRLHDFTSQSVDDAIQTIDAWNAELPSLTSDARLVAERTLPDIRRRLQCLSDVGIGYLTLDRATRTLSGGEFQRARLAACLGTSLHGACFVLDEPTSGLHPRDTEQLLKTLKKLRDDGGTVVVVEHDGAIMKAADQLIDLGPGAGIEGGQLMFSGPPKQSADSVDTPTARYLRGELFATVDSTVPAIAADVQQGLTIRNARRNNLENLTLKIPLQRFVCVTGVSGCGKTSLVMDTLLPIAEAHCRREGNLLTTTADAECDGIDGLEHVQRVVAVDNTPLGRNRRSCIATYSKLWNEVRRLFAKTRESRARGYGSGRFSFNSGDGRCDQCKGTGVQDLRMNFLPDVTVPCSECLGQRFNRATLNVRFAGRNAADVLAMRVDEAAEFFAEFRGLSQLLKTFQNVGLGYLTLGQPASTFSGGEAQRVKLATELARTQLEPTLFILDEPTSGLHPADVVHLIDLLQGLVAAGHSVVVVEHSVELMQSSDWIIDLGPESGINGGGLVAEGPPATIAASQESLTGQFLDK